MIRVERSPTPPVLAEVDSPAAEERQAWLDYYQGKLHKDPEAEKPKFGTYRHETVKEALEAMFHGKCAYCEARVSIVTWGDIEHYRPKGAIDFDDGSKKKPGYWWLASSWENLLLACNRCNSRNRQEYEGEEEKITIGKGNRFPVEGDDRPGWDEDDPHGWQSLEKRERPLLLDPCSDEPRKSMECVTEVGSLSGVLVPLDDRGETSIKVLGLNRKPLVDGRREKLAELRGLQEDLRDLEADIEETNLDLADALEAGDGDRVKRIEERLRRKMGRVVAKRQRLQETGRDENEYLLMTRPFVRSALPAS